MTLGKPCERVKGLCAGQHFLPQFLVAGIAADPLRTSIHTHFVESLAQQRILQGVHVFLLFRGVRIGHTVSLLYGNALGGIGFQR
jgi:hypothetical protein